jgi:hypothetical protein
VRIDLSATMNFGDNDALQHFFLDHRLIHEQEARAITTRTGQVHSTFGVFDALAEESWLALNSRQTREPSRPLLNWLILHSSVHQNLVAALAGADIQTDLSIVDFSDADQFYDWMYVHQQYHDFEQQQLGLT